MLDILLGAATGCAVAIACYRAYRHGHQAGWEEGFAAGREGAEKRVAAALRRARGGEEE